MIYELRKYVAVAGKEVELASRFRDSTLAIFNRLGIRVDGFWKGKNDPGLIFYVVAWESEEQMNAVWDQFRVDEEWKRIKAETEQNGALSESIESTVLEAFC